MTKNREPMPVHELCKFVSDRSDDYRVYNWREVESMREDLARVSMGHSELAAKVNGLSHRLVMVHRVLMHNALKIFETEESRTIASSWQQNKF